MADQKLNIIVTADNSDLVRKMQESAKVIETDFAKATTVASAAANKLSNDVATSVQKINSSLTGLKVGDIKFNVNTSDLDKIENRLSSIRVKPIHLDFELTGETELNKAITSIKERFSALRLNPNRELFDELIADINKLKTNEILLHVDNSQALSEINKVAALAQSIKGDIIITSNIDQTLLSIKTRVESLREFDLRLNPTDAILQVDKVLNEIVQIKNQEILLRADNSDALAKINQLEIVAKDIRANIQVNATGFIESQKQVVSLADRFAEAEKRIHASVDKMVADAINGSNKINSVFGNIKELRVDVQATGAQRTVTGLNNFQAALGKSTQAIRNLQATGNGLNSFYGNLVTQNNRAVASLNKLPQSGNAASFAMLNFGRVIQDAPFGILGIANNLNPLIESLGRASAAAKETGTSLGKNLLGSLKGAGGIGLAVSVVSSLLIVFGDRLFGAGKKAENAAGSVDDFKKSIDSLIRPLNQIESAGIGDAQGELVQIRALSSVILDLSNSYTQRNNALKQLQDINKNYFGDLSLEASELGKLKLAVEGYTQALIAQSVQKAFLDDIGKVSKEFTIQADILQRLRKQFTDTYGIQLRGTDASTKTTIEEQKQKRKLNEQIGVQQEAVTKLGSQYEILKDQVNAATLKALKFKPLKSGTEADFKDQTDSIIARARQFAKEFGETFIVPDLEDSFFKTKTEIFKLSKQLLDDVKNANLIIKLPVKLETEFDLLPVEIDTKITEDQIKELTKGFFEGVKLEQQDLEVPVTINAGNIQLLEKFRKIFADLRAEIPEDLKLKFLDNESFVAFDRLNEALKQAQNNFILLQTIGQSVGEGLSNAFDNVFDALLEGENVFKALGESVKALVVETIKAIAKMLILKLVTKALGGGVPLPTGGGGGQANPFSAIGIGGLSARGFVGSAFGGQSAPTLTTRVSGTDLVFVLNQGNNIIGRSG